MIQLTFLLAIVPAIVINVLVSRKFENIAIEKGYSGYFWWCFFTGIAGYIMVTALPYKRANQSALKDDELVRLCALHDKGVLSDEEYETMRAKLQGKS